MTLDTFFKKFDPFADAPDAVAKMRELVLQLAVQGKLVEPPSKPETDRTWLAFKKEISERVYSYDPGPPPPFDIPEHWEWCVLGDVAKPCGQKTPDENFTYIDVGSIDNARGELKPDLNTIEAAHAPSRARKLAKLGSVIYATVRPYLKNIAVIETEFSPPAIISTAFAILHPLPFVESRFLFYWLRSSAFEREVSVYAKGVAYPAISDGDLKGCVIPVPPPSEQKRIVAKVDELMALCDRLEAQQQERDEQASALARASLARFAEAPTPANLNLLFHKSYSISPVDLRKAILAMAIQGKIVPQAHDDKPAVKNIEQNGELVTKVPFEIPRQWRWFHLSQLADINGGFAFKSHDYSERGMRVVRISDFDEFGFKDHKIVRHAFKSDLKKFTLDEGNILMAMTGGTVGKSYYVRSLPEPMIVNQRVATIKVSPEVNPSYIDILIRSEMTQEVIRIAKNSTNDNISMGDIKGFAVPVPPLAEQHRIVAKVDQLMALVDQLETQLAASRATSKNLLEALVAELT
jgi:type I restriction enzyme S subunit